MSNFQKNQCTFHAFSDNNKYLLVKNTFYKKHQIKKYKKKTILKEFLILKFNFSAKSVHVSCIFRLR